MHFVRCNIRFGLIAERERLALALLFPAERRLRDVHAATRELLYQGDAARGMLLDLGLGSRKKMGMGRVGEGEEDEGKTGGKKAGKKGAGKKKGTGYARSGGGEVKSSSPASPSGGGSGGGGGVGDSGAGGSREGSAGKGSKVPAMDFLGDEWCFFETPRGAPDEWTRSETTAFWDQCVQVWSEFVRRGAALEVCMAKADVPLKERTLVVPDLMKTLRFVEDEEAKEKGGGGRKK